MVMVVVMMIQFKKNYQNVINSKMSSLAFTNVIWSKKTFCDRLHDLSMHINPCLWILGHTMPLPSRREAGGSHQGDQISAISSDQLPFKQNWAIFVEKWLTHIWSDKLHQ